MTIANTLKANEAAPLLPVERSPERPHSTSGFKSIFIGPNGLRAGWRVLIFTALVVVLLGSFVLIRAGGVQGLREAQKHAAELTVTPLLMFKGEGIAFLLLCVAALIMGKIEHRKFSEYGLHLRLALRKDFWIGALSGFLAISGTLLTIFLLHGFRVTAWLFTGRQSCPQCSRGE
jgi:hypothetical protein